MVSHERAPLRQQLAYQLLYDLSHASLGRRTLVERTGLTESVVRTELEKLQVRKLVTFSKLGTTLTAQGRQAISSALGPIVKVQELRLRNLMLDKWGRAAHVHGSANSFRTWIYRDLAIRAGATATLFLTRWKGSLSLLEEEMPLAERNAHDAKMLEEAFPRMRKDDLLVIVFGPERGSTARGLWSILCALGKKSK